MCGIAGLVMPTSGLVAVEHLKDFDRALAHRGPDDYGFLGWSPGKQLTATREPARAAGGRVGFVHRRLSILDLGETGWQPMVADDGATAIIFNGEVYNYLELREVLVKLGHEFRGRSDTEVVLAAWREWGVDALRRFTGMFAFAVLDPTRRRLVLARDPFGIKPLYWAPWRNGFAFASEIPALLGLPGIDRTVDPQSLYEYLRFGLTDRGESTMLSVIRRLPAGHWMEVPLDGPVGRPQPYWTLRPETLDVGFDEAATELRRLFLDSVSLHLRSDVPLASALSGGIDSSSILAAARAVSDGGEIQAFSFVNEDADQSEEKWADLMGAAAGVRIHKTKPSATDLGREINRLIALQGEPFPTTGIFAQERVFALVCQQRIKVSLDGQGADELLAGYPTYRSARLADLLVRRDKAALGLLRADGWGTILRAGGLLLSPSLARLARRLVGEDEVPSWLAADWFHDRGVVTIAPDLPRRRTLLHDRLEQTVTDLSLPALLRFADRNSMAHSVESRVPFLTTRLAEFVLSLPASYLVANDGTTKSVFRRAMRGLVPDTILDRRDKVGFAVPEKRWLNGLRPWAGDVLTRVAGTTPMLRSDVVLAQWGASRPRARNQDSRFWRWINLVIWSELYQVGF
jgi:asparagine synthase (glutamine-hydrolysing)